MGDRYARYWKAVYDLAVKRNPNVKIGVYLYHNTLPAPLTDIKLNKNIFGEFVIYGVSRWLVSHEPARKTSGIATSGWAGKRRGCRSFTGRTTY